MAMVEQRSEGVGTFEQDIARRLGLVPKLFQSAPAAPETTGHLWQFAKSAYFDAPLPSPFKERLAVHLSRICRSSYCLALHLGFLVGLGRAEGGPEAIEGALGLLSLPLAEPARLEAALARLEAVQEPVEIPEPRSEGEADLFEAAAALCLQSAAADRARRAIRNAFGATALERLNALLAYLRMAHFWADAHPDLTPDADVLALLRSNPELSARLSNELCHDPSPVPAEPVGEACEPGAHRLLRMLEIDSVGVLFFDHAQGTLIDANDAFLAMTGYSRDDVRSRRLTWRSLTPPEWLASSEAQIDQLRQTGRIGPYEKEYFRKNGERAWMMFAGRDVGDGTLVELAMNIDDRKRTEAALRDSEARFRRFGEASSDVLWIRDAESLQWEYLSPAFEAIYGVPRDAVFQGDHLAQWTALMLPEDRPRALEAINRVKSGERVYFDFRVLRQSDQQIRWLRICSFPMVDEAGQVQRIGGICQDVTALVEAAEHQKFLLAELQHRVRNMLAVIRSIVRRTGDSNDNVEDFASHLEGRITALGRVQVAVTRDPLAGFDLAELIADELRACAAREDQQFSLSGPPMRIKAKVAESIGLAMHELATNALKYGALTVPRGFIRIEWRLEDSDADSWLVINWTESGMSGRPLGFQRRGFGTVLLEQMLPYDVGARVTRRFAPNGLHCEIGLPAGNVLK